MYMDICALCANRSTCKEEPPCLQKEPEKEEMLSVRKGLFPHLLWGFLIALALDLPVDVDSPIHSLGSVIPCQGCPYIWSCSAHNTLELKGHIVATWPCSLSKQIPPCLWFYFCKSILALTFAGDPALPYLVKLRQAWPEKWLRKKIRVKVKCMQQPFK